MHIVYSDELKDYMTCKGLSHIEIGLVEANTCCSGFADIVTDFVADKDLPRIEKKIVRVLDGEVGDILVTARGLEYDEEIELGLKSFLGIKDITVKGVRAWSM